MAWVSPTGHNDPDTEWINEEQGYNDDTGDYASDSIGNDRWGSYLELTIASISCDKVRFWAWYSAPVINTIDLDVYYDGDWHDVYQGSYANEEWVEKSIPAGTKSVTKARVRFYNEYGISISCRLYDFDFNEVSAGTTHYGAATLSGTGALSAAAKAVFAASDTLSGTGSLAASGSKILSGISTFAGAGSLIVNGVASLAAKATLAGAGLLAAAGTIEGGIKYGAAILSGSGTLVAAGVTAMVGAVTIAGTGALAAAAVKILSGAATLSGIGLLSAIGGLLGDVCGSAILAGQGSISVIAESWHILTGQEYQDLLEGQIEFQEI